MARPGRGPRLARVRKDGWTRAVYYIRWTEHGRTRERSTGATDLANAEAEFAEWLSARDDAASGPSHVGHVTAARAQCALPPRPGDPANVRIADVLTAYALEHGGETAAPERIGPRPGSPVTIMWPPMPWTIGSRPGQ